MKPVVDRLKPEYEGRVEFRLMNVETDRAADELAGQFGVRFVPTFIFLSSSGEQVRMEVGEIAEADLRAMLDSLE